MTHLEDAILKRWQELKAQNVPSPKRMTDPIIKSLLRKADKIVAEKNKKEQPCSAK